MKQPNFSPPVMPTLPLVVLFDNELAARRTLFALFDRARKEVNYQMQWTEGRQAQVAQTGTEIFYYKPETKNAMLEMKSGEVGNRTIRRAIADSGAIVDTMFQETPKRPTVREFSRISTGLIPTVRESLVQIGLMPRSALGAMALELRFRVTGRLWQGTDGAVYSHETPRDNLVVVRRFQRDAKQNLVKYEEWTQRTGDKTPRYRREEYQPAPRMTNETFSQNLPPSYTEKKLTVRETPPTLPVKADPRALALWEQWGEATERYLTLETDIQVALTFEARDPNLPEGRQGGLQEMTSTYHLAIHRPRRAFMTYKTLSGSTGRRGRNQDEWGVVSDGTQARNVSKTQKTKFNNGDDLWNGLARVGAQDNLRLIHNLLDGPQAPAGGDTLTYGGKQPLTGGGVAELVILTHKESDNTAGRQGETTTETRVFLGENHLPVEIHYTRRTDAEELRPRDLPPILHLTVRYAPLKIDIPLRLSQFSV
jgi:hypothetical protein